MEINGSPFVLNVTEKEAVRVASAHEGGSLNLRSHLHLSNIASNLLDFANRQIQEKAYRDAGTKKGEESFNAVEALWLVCKDIPGFVPHMLEKCGMLWKKAEFLAGDESDGHDLLDLLRADKEDYVLFAEPVDGNFNESVVIYNPWKRVAFVTLNCATAEDIVLYDTQAELWAWETIERGYVIAIEVPMALGDCGFDSLTVSDVEPAQMGLLHAGQMDIDDTIWWGQFGGGAAPESEIFVREDHARVLILSEGVPPVYLAGEAAQKWVKATLEAGEPE